jgi:D-sedoheptulose 7-phosphate isomerase
MKENFSANIAARIKQFDSLEKNRDIFKAIELIENNVKNGKKILVFGNGGSAAQASHFAAELVNKFYFKRPGLAAVALTDNIANITSIANDTDFKYVFSRQIEAIGRPGDIAVGISTSGASANVLEALKTARDLKLETIMLCGRDGKAPEDMGVDAIIRIDSTDTPLIQEMHLFILHFIAELIEKRLFPDFLKAGGQRNRGG